MRKFVFLLLGIAVIGCTEISYKEPQPKGVKQLLEVPSKLHGMYSWSVEGRDQSDTVIFFKNGFRANNKKEKDILYLSSDSLVLKKYKNYYFFNYREGGNWMLRVLEPQKNGDILYLEMENVPEDEQEKKIFIERLSKETPVIETMVDSIKHYTIDPSPKKLYSLIEKGFFKEKAKLFKIN